MKNTIEDKQLNYELQELYLIAKDWLLNIHFINDEILFLLYVLHKYAEPSKLAEPAIVHENFYRVLNEQKENVPPLVTEITTCLKTIEPLANNPQMINIAMLEDFSNTAQKVQELSAAVKAIKKQLFIEQIIKKERNGI
ncbi:hypothetical protein [Mucilaginibacter sp.]